MRTVSGSTVRPRLAVWISLVVAFAVTLTSNLFVVPDGEAAARKSYKSKKASRSYRKSVRKKRRVRRSVSRRTRKSRRSRRARRVSKANPRYAAYVIDAKTGKVLFARNADAKRYPASLTKMMTVYLLFEDLKAGRIKGSDRVVMTKAGARRPPSKLGLRVGQSISVDQAVLSLITKSANDVATAVGDKLSGSEAAFARRMTRKARQLGMGSTTFRNASGLTAKGQLTTAADMARLGLALREHFPRRYKLFTSRSMRLGKRRLRNHNRLLGRVRGVDGIKTGYTRASGYNLVTSARHGGRSIVAVVMGGRSGASRNAHMTKLVRQYLPRASRGKQRRLIARVAARSPRKVAKLRSSFAAGTLPKAAPLPTFAKRANGAPTRVALPTAPVRAATSQKVSRVNQAHGSRKVAAAPRARSAVDPVVTGSVAKAPRGTWQVQVAATDDARRAGEVLRTVRRSNEGILRGTADRTIRVRRGGTTFYRARFTGFASKGAARRACVQLKKRRIACLALPG